MDYMQKATQEFIEETWENLDVIDRDLVELEKNPGSSELIGNIFRAIHTIKGSSVFLGFNNLEALTHKGETLLAQVRDGKREMDKDIAQALLALVDSVRVIVKSIEESGKEPANNFAGLAEFLELLAQSDDPFGENKSVKEEPSPEASVEEQAVAQEQERTPEAAPAEIPTPKETASQIEGSNPVEKQSADDNEEIRPETEVLEEEEMKQLCTFYLDRHFFGISVDCVQEVIRYQEMTPLPLASEAFQGLINLRGQIVTAIDLRTLLSIEQRPAEKLPMNVVVKTSDGAVSFLVDEIGDVLEADENDFESPPMTIDPKVRSLIRGTYKLDGELLLVLDTERALDFHE